jgi:hypothetical protein
MVIFRTPGRVDVEPPSVADSLRECAMANLRAYQAAVDDLEDEVVEIFSSGCPRSPRNLPVQTAVLYDFINLVRRYKLAS